MSYSKKSRGEWRRGADKIGAAVDASTIFSTRELENMSNARGRLAVEIGREYYVLVLMLSPVMLL